MHNLKHRIQEALVAAVVAAHAAPRLHHALAERVTGAHHHQPSVERVGRHHLGRSGQGGGVEQKEGVKVGEGQRVCVDEHHNVELGEAEHVQLGVPDMRVKLIQESG